MTQFRLPASGGFDSSQLHGCFRRLLASARRASRLNWAYLKIIGLAIVALSSPGKQEIGLSLIFFFYLSPFFFWFGRFYCCLSKKHAPVHCHHNRYDVFGRCILARGFCQIFKARHTVLYNTKTHPNSYPGLPKTSPSHSYTHSQGYPIIHSHTHLSNSHPPSTHTIQ